MTTLAVDYGSEGYTVSTYDASTWRSVLTIPDYAEYVDCSVVSNTERICYGRRRVYYTEECKRVYAFDGQITTHITTLDTPCTELAEISGEICYAHYNHPTSTLDRSGSTVYLSWAVADKLKNIVHSDEREYVTSDSDGPLHPELPVHMLDTYIDKGIHHSWQCTGVWSCGSVWTTCNTKCGSVLVARDPRMVDIRQIQRTLYIVKGNSGGNLVMGSFETADALYDPRADAMYDLDPQVSAYAIIDLP